MIELWEHMEDLTVYLVTYSDGTTRHYRRYKNIDTVQLRGKIAGVCKQCNWVCVSYVKEY